MQYGSIVVAGLAAALGVPAAPLSRAQTPVAGSSDWQLDVRFHDPQRLVVQLPGEDVPSAYWYLVFEVVNNTGRDRRFHPSFRLVTNTLEVVEGGARISPQIYDLIAARHKPEFPFLRAPQAATGLLLQGRANARASVAVFRDFDPAADGFTVYAAGFSGSIQRMPNPVFDPSAPESESNPRMFVLRRTLAIEYDLPGDPVTRDDARPVRRTRHWVMR